MRASRLDTIERIDNDGLIWRPVRRHLGVTAFGVNGYTGVASGDVVIERHDETSPNSGRHEELYLVVRGRATFTVDGTTLDAPTGTFVLVSPGERREAVAAEPDTTVLVVGGTPGAALPVSPFEYWYAAQPHFTAGDYERAIAIASEGLTDHPEHGGLRYQLACYCAMSGRGDEAVEHLRHAFEADPRTRGPGTGPPTTPSSTRSAPGQTIPLAPWLTTLHPGVSPRRSASPGGQSHGLARRRSGARQRGLAARAEPYAQAVRLEPLSEAHVAALERLTTDPAVLRYTYVPDPPPPQFAEKWVARYGPETGKFAFAAIGDEGEFLGVGLVPAFDREAAEAEIGYIVAPKARGHGTGTAILRAVTDWLFAQAVLRIRLLVDVDNPASLAVAERAGYRREGVMRSVHFKQGRRADLVLLSRLPTD